MRRDRIELPGAVRWLRRRVRLVPQVLRRVIGLLPQHLAGCRPELSACRKRLGSDAVLVALRSLADPWLAVLPAPLGFRPHLAPGWASQFRTPTTPGDCRPRAAAVACAYHRVQ